MTEENKKPEGDLSDALVRQMDSILHDNKNDTKEDNNKDQKDNKDNKGKEDNNENKEEKPVSENGDNHGAEVSLEMFPDNTGVSRPALAAMTGFSDGKEKIRFFRRILLIVIGVLAAAAIIMYARIAYSYRNRFFYGTILNQMDVSGKTAAQTEKMLKKQTERYTLSVSFRGDQTETIDGSSISYTYVPDSQIRTLLKKQNLLLWPKGYFRKIKETIHAGIRYDQDKLDAVVFAFPEMQDENMTDPVPAHVGYQNEAFAVIEADNGTKLNKAVVADAITDAVSLSSSALNVEKIKDSYEEPEKTDHSAMQQEVSELNDICTASITYDMPDGQKEVLDGNTYINWLKKDDSGHYYKDEDTWSADIKQYISDLAKKYNTAGGSRKFNATGIGEVTVSGGEWGYRISQKKEIPQLTEELSSNTVTEREPVYAIKQPIPDSDNNGIGNTYVEVDLARQYMWVYQNGSCILESRVVTGKMTPDRYTPAGIYTLDYKQRNRDLKGQINPATGEPSYVSHVNYWMPFNGGVGFHDASWRSSFGGKIYVYSGSHGCVNLPTSFAPKLYSVINESMPIVVYASSPIRYS